MLPELGFLVLALLARWIWQVNQRPKGFPAGPKYALPLIGHAFQIGNNLTLAIKRFRYYI